MGYDVVGQVGSVATDRGQPLQVRTAAINALGHTRSAEAIPALQEAFDEGNPEIKETVARALQRIGAEAGTPLLMEALDSPSPEVADEAMRILARWPHADIQDLTKLLRADDEMLQDRAAVVLAAQQTAGEGTPLGAIGAVRENEALERSRGTIGELLTRAAGDEDATDALRRQAILALGNLAYNKGLSQLGELVRSRSDLSAAAAKAIARIGVKESRTKRQGEIVEITEAGKLLVEILMDTDSDEIRMEAAVALSLMQKGPVDELVSRLKDSPDELKPWIAATIGGIGKYATDIVANDRDRATDDDYRHWLAVALACIGDAAALHEIKFMPKDERPTGPHVEEAQQLTTEIRLRKK
jgi:HEAT repeat protein